MQCGQEVDTDREGLTSWLEQNKLTLDPAYESAAHSLTGTVRLFNWMAEPVTCTWTLSIALTQSRAEFGTRDSESKNAP